MEIMCVTQMLLYGIQFCCCFHRWLQCANVLVPNLKWLSEVSGSSKSNLNDIWRRMLGFALSQDLLWHPKNFSPWKKRKVFWKSPKHSVTEMVSGARTGTQENSCMTIFQQPHQITVQRAFQGQTGAVTHSTDVRQALRVHRVAHRRLSRSDSNIFSCWPLHMT